MIIDRAATPKIRREPYLEYEFQAHLDSGATVLFNDPTLSYNHLVALEINDKILRFQLVGAQPTMTIPGDDFLVYPSVLPQVDLAYELYVGRLKEILVINAPGAQHEFAFLLETEGVTANLQPDNSIIYKDADGNTVWTIEAPYATDATGLDVPVTMQFDGAQYFVKALPTETTVYPIKLDPTIAASSYIWQLDSTPKSVVANPFRMPLRTPSGEKLIQTVTVSNFRKTGDTLLYDNSNPGTRTFIQYYDETGAPMGDKANLVVSSINSQTVITPLAGAYAMEFTGFINSDADTTSKFTNNLRFDTMKVVDGAKTTTIATYLPLKTASIPTRVEYSLPQGASFVASSVSGTTSCDLYPPFGTTFVPGCYPVTTVRDYYGYTNGTIYFYDGAATSLGSVTVPAAAAPSTAGVITTAVTNVTVPANTALIRVSITKNGADYYTDSNSRMYGYFECSEACYGVQTSFMSPNSIISNACMVPLFFPRAPKHPYRLFTSKSLASNTFIETRYVTTATTRETIILKVQLTAQEDEEITLVGATILGSPNAIAVNKFALKIAGATAQSASYQMVVGTADGTKLLNSVSVLCSRGMGGTSYYDNSNVDTQAFYQFFNARGNALSSKTDIVVSTINDIAQITIPDGAYRLELTGAITSGTASKNCAITIQSVEPTDAVTTYIPAQDSVPTKASANFQIPRVSLASADKGQVVSQYIEAPTDKTFQTGTYSIASYNDGNGYFGDACCYVYDKDGILLHQDGISYQTGVGIKYNNFAMPEGATLAVIKGVFVSTVSFSSSSAYIKGSFTFNDSTGKSTLVFPVALTRNVSKVTVLPAFASVPPAMAVTTSISKNTTPNTASYTNTNRLTATEGTPVFLKTQFDAAETANANLLTGVFLLKDTGVPETSLADISVGCLRKVASTASPQTDTKRNVRALQTVQEDSKRRLSTTTFIRIDTGRKVFHTAAWRSDTKRYIAKDIPITANTRRKLQCVSVVQVDTKRCLGEAVHMDVFLDTARRAGKAFGTSVDIRRNIQKYASVLFDMKRRTTLLQLLQADTSKKSTQWTNFPLDTRRKVHAGIVRKIDVQRKTIQFIHAIYDTKRVKGIPIVLVIDTKRKIVDGVWSYLQRHAINIKVEENKIILLSFTD